MKKLIVTTSLLATALLAVLAGSTALAHGDRGGKAKLDGFQETPSISTTGHGSFRARIRSDGIHYTLRYEDLENDANVAHIHFAERHVAAAGNIIAFLCGGGGKPACPTREGRVTGVIGASDVIGPASQGIEPGSLSEAIRALRRGAVYANVHTTRWPGGEIRGQVGHHGNNGRR